jgi:hypothetical protein
MNSTSGLLTALTIACCALAVIIVVVELVVSGKTIVSFGTTLALLWLGLPPLVAYFISVASQPIFVSRYFEICLPAVALVIGTTLAKIRPTVVAYLGCAGMLALRGNALPSSYGQSVDDFRSATSAVLAASAPGDCIAFYAQDARVDFDYYVTHAVAREDLVVHPVPRSVLPDLSGGSHPAIVEQYETLSAQTIARDARDCQRMWVIEAHAGHPFGTAATQSVFHRFVVLSQNLRGAYPVHSVQVFPSVSVTLYAQSSAALGGGA